MNTRKHAIVIIKFICTVYWIVNKINWIVRTTYINKIFEFSTKFWFYTLKK